MARIKCSIKLRPRDLRLKDVVRFYGAIASNKVTVGVHGTQGVSNVKKAVANEFGGIFTITKTRKVRMANGRYATLKAGTQFRIPPRPFVRLYLYPNKVKRIQGEYIARISEEIRHGFKTPVAKARSVLKDVAFVAQKQMQETIQGNTTLEPNAPFTIARKGFDYPLVEKGNLLNSIKGKVKPIGGR